jgi:hypothetical protein
VPFYYIEGPIGYEPVTHGIKAHILYGTYLSIFLGGKIEGESGPGRNRTCDLADKGIHPIRLYMKPLLIQLTTKLIQNSVPIMD